MRSERPGSAKVLDMFKEQPARDQKKHTDDFATLIVTVLSHVPKMRLRLVVQVTYWGIGRRPSRTS